MSLFTDGFVSEVSDLVAYEADLPEVAAAEGIDLATKLRLAQTEVGAQLEASSRRPGNVFFARGAGWQSTGSETSLPRFELRQVAITPPLKLWHTFQALSLIYRDANTRRINDKYLPKWREYKELSSWAAEMLFQTGVGIVASPLPRAAAPKVDWAASSLEAMALYVRVSWEGQNGVEGAANPALAISVPENNALRVKTTETAPTGAAGWNVYVGTSPDEATKQNASPIDGASEWVMPASGLIEGAGLGNGQEPDLFRTVPRFLQRG